MNPDLLNPDLLNPGGRFAPGPRLRADALERLSSGGFDLLVVGGGITGAGIALDAASRGFAVALIERADFSAGTSSKSSKLVHGGLRYLQQRELGLVRQAAAERELLRRLAPHLVKRIDFLIPARGGMRGVGLGLWVYDLLAGLRRVRRHRRVGPAEVLHLVPGSTWTAGGYIYSDCLTDDSRLTLAVVAAARRAGAVVCNHVAADQFLEAGGRIAGCVARDTLGGASLEVFAPAVVNATGVWADDLRGLEDAEAIRRLRPSKGIHVVLSRKSLPVQAAFLVPAPDGRLIFGVPWRSSVIVGPTDAEYQGPLDAPEVTLQDVGYVLEALSRAFDRDFSPSEIVGASAGLRPLVAGADGASTRDLSRRHAILPGPKGLITITGGKLTTYRLMAEEVVDLVARRLGRDVPCTTRKIRLGPAGVDAIRREVGGRLQALGLDTEIGESLILSYGGDAPGVLEIAREMDLASPIIPELPYLWAEVVWGLREEMAATAEDLLARRMRLGLEDPQGGLGDRARLAALVASETGRRREETIADIGTYEASLARERGPSLPLPTSRS